MVSWAALIFGGLVLAFVLQDAFEVMLLPRRVQRRARMVRVYFRATWAVWTTAARAWPPGDRRERFLSVYGALSIFYTLWAAISLALTSFHPVPDPAVYVIPYGPFYPLREIERPQPQSRGFEARRFGHVEVSFPGRNEKRGVRDPDSPLSFHRSGSL